MAMQAGNWQAFGNAWTWLRERGWRVVLDGSGDKPAAYCYRGSVELTAEGDDEAAALATLARRAAGMEATGAD